METQYHINGEEYQLEYYTLYIFSNIPIAIDAPYLAS